MPPRKIAELECGDPFAVAAAKVVAVRAEELFERSEGVLDLDDIERVHEMRVASRRLRAAMEFFEPCFPRKRFRAALREVKALADALGERRDRDVSIEFVERYLAEVTVGDRRGVALLLEGLRKEQLEANDELAPFVTRRWLSELRERLEELCMRARRKVGAQRTNEGIPAVEGRTPAEPKPPRGREAAPGAT